MTRDTPSGAITIKLLYFAHCREAAGTEAEELAVPAGADVAAVREVLCARHPALARTLPAARLAINRAFARERDVVSDGDEVAVIPPVSGGAPDDPRFEVTSEPFGEHAAVARLTDPPERRGALVTFVGLVRAKSRGKRITHLDYEAYAPMAEAKMAEIGAEIRERWPVLDVAIVHRTGRLAVGDVAVSIAVSAEHRAEAFDGCRHAIERLKEDVPIWKRETADDGTQWWGRGP